MKPTISIIIPVYEHAAELVGCLRALRAQSLQAAEIIVVDDGSSDHPERVVEEAGLRGLITHWIHFETNQGAPEARNQGFARSTGEYVLFLDADACVVPDGLAKLAAALDADQHADFAYSAFRFGGKTFLSQPFSAIDLARGNYIHTSALLRRRAFPGFDPALRKFQDWDLWIRLTKAGGYGVYLPEVLLAIQERKTHGMSQWVPAFAYRFPWAWVGWQPKRIARYDEAKTIIEKKHAAWMQEMHKQARHHAPTLTRREWVGIGLVIAALSFVCIGTSFNTIVALALAVILFGCTIWRPSFGLAVLAFELILGSKGGWLKVGADAVNDGGVGIRIFLFAAFFFGWVISLARHKIAPRAFIALAKQTWVRSYLFFALVLVLGVVWAIARGIAPGAIIGDANAWGYLLLLVPACWLWTHEDARFWTELTVAIRAGLTLLVVFTLGLFLLFANVFPLPTSFLQGVYTWVRQSGLGEITRTSYSVARIFLQSQIMLLPAWLWYFVRSTQDQRPFSWRTWGAWIGIGAALFVSFSRSFWVGGALAALFGGLLVLISERKFFSWMLLKRVIIRPALAVVGSLALLFLIASASLPGAIGARFASGEPAVASRWSLLPIMAQGIRQHPLIGSGFGATLTYETSDPRLVQRGSKLYTTYAFEWGWHDLWYKLGLIGVISLVFLLGSLLWRAWRLPLSLGLFPGLSIFVLAIVHAFTPYLNHPLGIGVILFAEAWLVRAYCLEKKKDIQA